MLLDTQSEKEMKYDRIEAIARHYHFRPILPRRLFML
jgi:hypothetical protein